MPKGAPTARPQFILLSDDFRDLSFISLKFFDPSGTENPLTS